MLACAKSPPACRRRLPCSRNEGDLEGGQAREDYRAALKLNPNELTALNNLAWIQATCPGADSRDGKSAVEHVTRACQLTQWRVHGYVSTLAATCAEAGDFQKALTLAEQIKDEHLESDRAGNPARD